MRTSKIGKHYLVLLTNKEFQTIHIALQTVKNGHYFNDDNKRKTTKLYNEFSKYIQV